MKKKESLFLLFLITIFVSSCDVAKEILREANKEEVKIEKKEKKEQQTIPTSAPAEKPKNKTERKVGDVPLSGKIDPDGLPVSSDEAMKQLEEKTFPLFFNIDNDVTVRHRNLTAKQIETIKTYITEVKAEFFESFSLKKDEPNATEDYTVGVIIDVFDTDDLYKEMFPKLFDHKAFNDADLNAGMCFENNPSFKGNIVRIALKRFKDIDEFEILNLKHEFIHYLDMRYNWASVGLEPNDWWMEGLAEYFGNPDHEKEDIKIIKRKKYTLKTIMKGTKNDNSVSGAEELRYSGGHMVIKYMFDKRIKEMEELVDIIRNENDEEKYNKWIKDFVAKYNVDFSKWIVSLK